MIQPILRRCAALGLASGLASACADHDVAPAPPDPVVEPIDPYGDHEGPLRLAADTQGQRRYGVDAGATAADATRR